MKKTKNKIIIKNKQTNKKEKNKQKKKTLNFLIEFSNSVFLKFHFKVYWR